MIWLTDTMLVIIICLLLTVNVLCFINAPQETQPVSPVRIEVLIDQIPVAQIPEEPVRRVRNQGGEERFSGGLTKAQLASLPVFSHAGAARIHSNNKSSMHAQTKPFYLGSDCSICLEDYAAKQTLKHLPICGHVFHKACIDVWLVKHNQCPQCRSVVVA